MKQIGDILKTILNKSILETAQEHQILYASWNEVVEEAYTKKRYIKKIDTQSNVSNFDIYNNKYIELINARKAADHSSIKYIKNNILYIEAEHPGWIQILQTKQHDILRILQRRFAELNISAIAFVLENAAKEDPQKNSAANNIQGESSVQNAAGNSKVVTGAGVEKTAFVEIKDEELKQILAELGKKAESKKNNSNLTLE